MSEKIENTHCERTAYVYVRQSSPGQVRSHRQSQKRQYALAEHARRLGFRNVVVIDDDLGRSGTGMVERPGFGKLLTVVCDGVAGAVVALEASRLARNNRDWHHLLDLCGLTNTLVIDEDGVYNPQHPSDRLLLGLKGSMAEFELRLLNQRAQAALRQMIEEGQVLWEPPVGFVRTESNGLELTADRQVQDAIRGVFRKFRELGSVRQVLLWYRQEKIDLPHTVKGTKAQQIEWKLPVYNRIHKLVTNPVYAGAFVWGRTTTRTRMENGRARKTRGHHQPIDEWEVLIRDHHPGYITWEDYMRNREQIAQNNGSSRGAPREGAGLLAGLLRCRRCGRQLHVAYSGTKGNVPRYHCRGGHVNHGTARCLSFGGMRVDEAISRAVLEAVQPAGVEAALHAQQRLNDQVDEKRSALERSLEKARYEADRVRRQYEAADPENRLVAGELESRWEEALQRVTDLQQRLDSECREAAPVTAPQRNRLMQLGQDLETAWHHSQASESLKKRILRTVLEEIVVDVSDDPPEVVMTLHWSGGVHTQLRMAKNRTGQHRYRTDRKVTELLPELARVCRDKDIAAILNRLGLKTGRGKTWIASRVASLRNRLGVKPYSADENSEYVTLQEAARTLGVSAASVRRLIEQNVLPASQVIASAPWLIRREHLQLAEVQSAVQAIRSGRKVPRRAAGQTQFPFK
ncbi:MAG: recombinase family protein [Fuerstiella sp.]